MAHPGDANSPKAWRLSRSRRRPAAGGCHPQPLVLPAGQNLFLTTDGLVANSVMVDAREFQNRFGADTHFRFEGQATVQPLGE